MGQVLATVARTVRSVLVLTATAGASGLLTGCEETTLVAVRNGCDAPIEVDVTAGAVASHSWHTVEAGDDHRFTLGSDGDRVLLAVRHRDDAVVTEHRRDDLPAPRDSGTDLELVVDGARCP